MFSWLFGLITGALGGIFYVILVYIPLWILNIFYNLFKFIGSGFSQAIFHTQIINGRLVWQFNWGGQIFTIVILLIIISAAAWLFYLLIKINRRNAMRRFGNDGEVQEHMKFALGYPLFLVASPFIIMLVSTLVTILISIFNKNRPATLSNADVIGLKTYMLANLIDLQNINYVKIDVGGQEFSITQALGEMQTQLTNAITQANGNGRADIANQLQIQLNDVNKILNYLQYGGMNDDIQNLTFIINQLQTGSLDLSGKLAGQIANISERLDSIKRLFNNCLSDYKNLGQFHAVIINWDSQFNSIFLTFDGLKASADNIDSNVCLGRYIANQKGIVDRIIFGDDKQIGLQVLQLKTMGMTSMNLVEQIYTFITGDRNGSNWSSNLFDGWGDIGLPNIIIGFIFTVIADLIIMRAAWRVAQNWVIIIWKWMGTIMVFAKGQNNDFKQHTGEMLTIWVELFFTYIYMELATAILPFLMQWLNNFNNVAQWIIGGAGLLFADAVLLTALVQSRRTAMLFGNSDAIDYYANNTTIGDAAAETIGKTTKIVNKAVKWLKDV